MHTVYIVIVNWNGKEDTLECLRSLYAAPAGLRAAGVIVVDNASTDDSVAAIKKRYPGVVVIPQSSNTGFTGGNTIGMKYAMDHGASHVWLLNNDTTVAKDTLPQLIRSFEHPRVGIAAPKIYFSAGREFHHDRYKHSERGKVLWYAGGLVDWANMYASHRGVDEVDRGQYNREEETEFITGCSMCIKREVIEAVGYLDDRYFVYLEDLDYSLRTKRAGFSLMYTPKAVVWHKNAGSTARPGNMLHEYYLTRNRLLIGFTYAPLRTRLALIRESFFVLCGSSKVRKKAVIDFLFGKFGNRYSWK